MPKFKDSYGPTGWGIIAIVVGGLFTFIAVVFTVAVTASYYSGRSSCNRFSNNTHRLTEYRRAGPLSWECYTPSGHGRWVPTSALREFGGKP